MSLYPLTSCPSSGQPLSGSHLVWRGEPRKQSPFLWWGCSLLPSTWEGKEKTLTLINVYCPHAGPEKPERLAFKMRFYRLLQIRAEALMAAGRYYNHEQQGLGFFWVPSPVSSSIGRDMRSLSFEFLHSLVARHQHVNLNRLSSLRAVKIREK